MHLPYSVKPRFCHLIYIFPICFQEEGKLVARDDDTIIFDDDGAAAKFADGVYMPRASDLPSIGRLSDLADRAVQTEQEPKTGVDAQTHT